MEYIKRNLDTTLERIKELAGEHEVTLVCVTKSGTDEELVELCQAGATDIGENRPQELVRRGKIIKDRGYSPRLHEIGHLQKNKVRHIIEDVALIHSLDNIELAMEIDKRAKAANRVVPVLIEVNSGKEENKSGVMPEDAEEFFLEVRKLENISVVGLMTMGPVCENTEEIRPYFRLTKELFDKLGEKYGYEGTPTLSMGMSDSFEVAIEEGANLVRIGRRLFTR